MVAVGTVAMKSMDGALAPGQESTFAVGTLSVASYQICDRGVASSKACNALGTAARSAPGIRWLPSTRQSNARTPCIDRQTNHT